MSHPTTMPRTAFRLGPWRVDPSLNRLLAEGKTHRVTPKTMEVLLCLARQEGGVVGREELLSAVWPDTHIREEVLTRAISDLRAALGDDRRQPRFVETIPKVGYRLVMPVHWDESSAQDSGPWSASNGAGEANNGGGAAIQPSTAANGHGPSAAPASTPEGDRMPTTGRGTTTRGAPLLAIMLVVALLAISVATVLVRDLMGDRSPEARLPGQGEVELPLPEPLQAFRLTSTPGMESFAEISPDGQWVAYAYQAPEQRDTDLYVVPSGGGEPRQLTRGPEPELGVAWSPDSQRLAFQRFQATGEERCQIIEISLAGGPERQLGSCGDNVTADLAWSPNGEWLAFSDREEEGQSFGIYLLSTRDGSRHHLVSPSGEHWGYRDPAFSPDGRQLAYTRSTSMATQDVYRIALDAPAGNGDENPVDAGAGAIRDSAVGATAPSVTAVSQDGRSIHGHAFSADGRAVLASSRRTGARGLWRFPLDGGKPQWLPIAMDHAWRPTLSRDPAGPLIFEHRDLQSGIFSVHLGELGSGPVATATDGDGELPELSVLPWLEANAEDLHPQVSPRGDRVAFASSRSGRFEIWIAHRDGSQPRQLTSLQGSFTGSPSWSPDGSELVFDTRLDGQADIYRLNVEDGAVQRLTRDPANDLAPSFSSDGHSIYFGSNRSGRWQIWRLPAGGSAAQQVTTDGGYRALATHVPDELIHTRYGVDGLFRYSLDSDESQPIEGTESLISHAHWTFTGRDLFLLVSQERSLRVLRMRAGQPLESLATLQAPRLMSGFDVAPDQQSVLLTRVTRLESDLWRVPSGPF